ncbi:MAG: PHP domain-containing protein [Desulfovibrio sp.]|nr:PHP domain-containing protein [Desulfovibrio sp.]
MRTVDLHTHSTASDGTDSPVRLVENAHSAGLCAIALTDHDTTAGLAEAEAAGREFGIDVIRGCELSTRTEKGEIHIVGLWLPKDMTRLKAGLDDLANRRRQRNERMVEKLCALGLPMTLADLKKKAGDGSIGRPHMAAVMVERGYVRDAAQAFRDYLGDEGKAYVPKAVFTPEEGVRLLAANGATAVLAHPLIRHACPAAWLHALIERLVPCGLDAIEAWHTEQDAADTRQCLEWAKEFCLGVSGGSDYHGANKPGVHLGTGYGRLCVPEYVVDDLKQRRAAKGLPC